MSSPATILRSPQLRLISPPFPHRAPHRAPKRITAADLFCGSGGSGTGLSAACDSLGYQLDLTAINHWSTAIATHERNYPRARHLCESLDSVEPRALYPGGRLNLLWASPECTHHSRARGSKPCSDQSRASIWHITRWASALFIDTIIIENVPELVDYGPTSTTGKPLKGRKGETFQAWLAALRGIGYNAEWRILNAADYGDPTTRQRFILIARRGNKHITWPAPTHSRDAATQPDLFRELQPWTPARSIIDWSLPSQSIFTRKRPLAPATLDRIQSGLRKFTGHAAEPFIMALNHGKADHRSYPLSRPLSTVTSADTWAFVTPYYGTAGADSVDAPLPAVTTHDRFGLVQAYGRTLDIHFRMLQPHELAAAMSFPRSYQFTGTRAEQVRQIGNAVPVRLAAALCKHVLAA